MKQVDMSPAAVTLRLRQLEQIWELSVALLKAGKEARKKEKDTKVEMPNKHISNT